MSETIGSLPLPAASFAPLPMPGETSSLAPSAVAPLPLVNPEAKSDSKLALPMLKTKMQVAEYAPKYGAKEIKEAPKAARKIPTGAEILDGTFKTVSFLGLF